MYGQLTDSSARSGPSDHISAFFEPELRYRTALRANASDGVAAYNLAALLLSHGNKASLDAAEEVESRPMMSLPDRLIDVVTDESGKIENRTMSKSLLDEVGSLLSVALSDTRIASKCVREGTSAL